MKKIISTAVALLLTSSLYAMGDKTQQQPAGANKTSQAKLASDMRVMLESVVNIQRAGFYNNKAGIKSAAKELITSLDSLITSDASTYLPHDKANAGKFAHKRQKMIKMYAEDLISAIDAGNFDESLEDYNQILKQCTSCHSRIRDRMWK
jgi:cytochrome c556